MVIVASQLVGYLLSRHHLLRQDLLLHIPLEGLHIGEEPVPRAIGRLLDLRHTAEEENDGVAQPLLQPIGPGEIEDREEFAGRLVDEFVLEFAIGETMLDDPVVDADEGAELLVVLYTTGHCAHLAVEDRLALRDRFSGRATMQEAIEEAVRRCGQELAPGRAEIGVALDLPEIPVHRDPVRFDHTGVPGSELLEVLRRVAIRDTEVRLLGEEGEVREGVDLWALVPVLVEPRLREDMVELQARSPPEEVARELEPGAPVPCLPDPGQHVEEWVEAGATVPAREVVGVDP